MLRTIGKRANEIEELQGESTLTAIQDCWQLVWAMWPNLKILIWSTVNGDSSQLQDGGAVSRPLLVYPSLKRLDLTLEGIPCNIKWIMQTLVKPHADAVNTLLIRVPQSSHHIFRFPDFAMQNLHSLQIHAWAVAGELCASNLQRLCLRLKSKFVWRRHIIQDSSKLQVVEIGTTGDIDLIDARSTGLSSIRNLTLVSRTLVDHVALAGLVEQSLQNLMLRICNPTGSHFDVSHLLDAPGLVPRLRLLGLLALDIRRR